MDVIIPPLKLKILLESNPLNSRILVLSLAVFKSSKLVNLNVCLGSGLRVGVEV